MPEEPHYLNRGKWTSKTEFMLSCIGYAVGIGNVWRFPYLCYRSGGGAFLVPYLLMLFLCGIPLFLMEIIMGQFTSIGCIGVFRLVPILKGTGYAIVVVNLLCTCYYSVIIAYPILFIWKTFSATLPWTNCNNAWNTENCVEVTQLSQGNFMHNGTFKTAADEFFQNEFDLYLYFGLLFMVLNNAPIIYHKHEHDDFLEILKISNGIEELGSIIWPLFWCLVIAWLIIYICIIKGIKSVGKVVYFTATFPFFILFILFIRGITLPGAIRGISFYITPEWTRLCDLKVWADAAIQIFFSLGPGWGGIINMASFNQFHNNAKNDAIIIPIINCSTSIFAGFVVFSILGYLSYQTGIPVATVATSGPGLAFITYPQAVAMLPLPHLWAALFFLMLFLLGLDSVFVQIEAILSSIFDELPKMRQHKFAITIASCFIMFLMSLIMVTQGGMFILQLLDWYSASISVILICTVEIIMIAWIYGVDNFVNDIYFMIGKRLHFSWKYYWKYITPLILIFIFFTSVCYNRNITYNGVIYPKWAISVGWLSCCCSIICIPAYMLYFICFQNDIVEYQNEKFFNWSPADVQQRRAYEEFKQNLNCTHDI